jgi:solute carrier family 15 (peptide/histidine transporter), member 3/4
MIQMPDSMRSVGIALYASILGIGAFMSSTLISFIDKITSRNGDSWFSNNLNRAHLDYFYWLLAGLNILELILFIYLTRGYVYKKQANAL